MSVYQEVVHSSCWNMDRR